MSDEKRLLLVECSSKLVSVVYAVGKIRKQFLERTISSPGLGLLRAVKQYLDPQNIFGNGNLMVPDARL